ncbi:MAG: hypothetical protein ACWGOL_09570 [Desulfuromonadales bacterium]
MTDGLLDNIILLEKIIQAEVAREQVRAEDWRALELSALQGSLITAQAEENQRCQQQLAEKKEELLREQAAVEAASLAWCQLLTNLDEATLISVLRRHMATILPGGDHDHPHGQG